MIHFFVAIFDKVAIGMSQNLSRLNFTGLKQILGKDQITSCHLIFVEKYALCLYTKK